MIRAHHFACIVLAVAGTAAARPAGGQQGPSLIRQGIGAYNDFDPQRALPLLRRGVDPKAGPRDSLWGVGVQYLAQILYEQGEEATARAWIWWAVRLDPSIRADSLNLLSSVLREFRRAQASASGGSGDRRVATDWVWPATDPGGGPGRLEVAPTSEGFEMRVAVAGHGRVEPRMTLTPGTYEVEAMAPGRAPVRVAREVLPGVTTVLSFALEAELDSMGLTALTERVANVTAGVTARRFGVPMSQCGVGTQVAPEGLILTTYRAIRGAETVIVGAGAEAADAMVAAYDVERDLAVLEVPERANRWALMAERRDAQYGWGFGFRQCRLGAATPADLTFIDPSRGLLRLGNTIPGVVTGSPLVDREGALVAVAATDSTAIAASTAGELLRQARENTANGVLLTPGAVATAERHRFGSVTLTWAGREGATASITPQESWHWPELVRTATLPFAFVGPEGRYRLAVGYGADVGRDTVLTVLPGATQNIALGGAQVTSAKRRRFPWALAALGAAGVGAVVAVLAGGDGPPPSTTGTISIRLPNSP